MGADDHDDADVSAQVHELLADPLEFLLWVSGVVGGDEGLDELDHLVEGLAQQTCWAMWSVLAAIGELSHHDELRARCRRALERPHSPLPDWVARLDETVAYGALKSTYAGGDRDDVIVGLRLANGYEFAVVVGVRRETNEVIDLLAIRAPLADVPQKVRVVTGGRVPTTTAVALDAARRRIGRALGSTDSTLSFVMVRWVVRVLERADGVVSTPDVSGPGAEWYAAMLDLHARRVGGTDALARLDAAPLPDEPFRWDGIPDDIRARVTAVVDLCDACADALGSVEYRTAFRRFLAAAARGDPSAFRRRSRAAPTAAAVCWAVGKANRLFAWPGGGGLRVGALMTYLGLRADASPSQRAARLLRAAGFDDCTRGWIALGSPRYLVSRVRTSMVQDRDRWRRAVASLGAAVEHGHGGG